MSSFTYFKKTGEINLPERGWDGDEGYEFEYEPEYKKIKKALVGIATSHYFGDLLKKTPEMQIQLTERVEKLIDDSDSWDFLEERFNDELKEHFEDEAQASED